MPIKIDTKEFEPLLNSVLNGDQSRADKTIRIGKVDYDVMIYTCGTYVRIDIKTAPIRASVNRHAKKS